MRLQYVSGTKSDYDMDYMSKRCVWFFLIYIGRNINIAEYVLEWIPNLLNHVGKNIRLGQIYHYGYTYQMIIFEFSVLA